MISFLGILKIVFFIMVAIIFIKFAAGLLFIAICAVGSFLFEAVKRKSK